MRWPNFARFDPWAAGRKKRLQQYLETEQHEFRDAIDVRRKAYDDKAQGMDLELFREGREASNWLENRETRMLPLMLEYQRSLIDAQIHIRTELGKQCPELLADTELAKLQETMLQFVRIARQARRDDYTRRTAAAGVPMRRPEQSDAAAYADLEELVRREIRKLVLARSLGRIEKPSRIRSLFKLWLDMDPVTRAITGIIGLLTAIVGFAAAVMKFKK